MNAMPASEMKKADKPQVSVISIPEGARNWPLVMKFLQLRKQIFIDGLRWPLHHDNLLEYEQYDTITSVYLIAHNGDKVLGGGRLVRTDRTQSIGRIVYTYMIRDAYLKNLPGLPPEICDEEPPVDPSVWEFSRFATIGNDSSIASAILDVGIDYLRHQGARKCLFLGPPGFMRMARRMGYQATPLGKIVSNDDGRFLAFSCDLAPLDCDKAGSDAQGVAATARTQDA